MTKKKAIKEVLLLIDKIEELAVEHDLSVVAAVLDPKGERVNNMMIGKGENLVDMLYTLVSSHEDIKGFVFNALVADKEDKDNSDINLN